MLLVTALRWTLEHLAQVRANALLAYPNADLEIRDQLDAALALLDVEPVLSAQGVPPGRPEIMALRSEGAPWGAVADVAEELRTLEASLHDLAWRLLLPDDAIRWRLFHLGVLGILLGSLRDTGCFVTSLRPFGASADGPAYRVRDPFGRNWDLWFEASGIWPYQRSTSPYSEATRGLPGAGRALGADLLLIYPNDHALILECKYSTNPEVVGRNGYYQATTYATEIRTRLAGSVTSIVVGPEGVVPVSSFTRTVVGAIGIIPPSAIHRQLREFLDRSAPKGESATAHPQSQ